MDKEEILPRGLKMDNVDVNSSILNSVKKALGILPGQSEFDSDVIIHINSALAVLTQLGIGPFNGFFIVDDSATYHDFLGDKESRFKFVNLYLVLKTKLLFDPPSNPTVVQTIIEQIKELEWRLRTLNEEELIDDL